MILDGFKYLFYRRKGNKKQCGNKKKKSGTWKCVIKSVVFWILKENIKECRKTRNGTVFGKKEKNSDGINPMPKSNAPFLPLSI